ncbi:Lsr2 family protein [bacterium]|nr:MAG: Lsr2 family protein [bacterium]
MARKETIILVDDVDGSEAVESIEFALDGVTYEIDVSAVNALQLRAAIGHWAHHARTVKMSKAKRFAGRKSPKPKTVVEPDTATVRAWANSNGYNVGKSGRISKAVREAFSAAQQKVAPTKKHKR